MNQTAASWITSEMPCYVGEKMWIINDFRYVWNCHESKMVREPIVEQGTVKCFKPFRSCLHVRIKHSNGSNDYIFGKNAFLNRTEADTAFEARRTDDNCEDTNYV